MSAPLARVRPRPGPGESGPGRPAGVPARSAGESGLRLDSVCEEPDIWWVHL